MPTKKQILDELTDLEDKYHLLSGDAIWQEDLFEIQPRLCKLMVGLANETGYDLPEKLPHLFKSVPKK